MIIEQMRRELEPRVSHDKPTGPLFHYTDAHAFLGIIEHRQIWATDYRFLNDADEMLIGQGLICEEAQEMARKSTDRPWRKWLLDNFCENFDSFALTKAATIYVASFSEYGNILSQWRAYGANGAGYSIGLSHLRVPHDNPDDATRVLMLVRCLYDRGQFRVAVRDELEPVCAGGEKYIMTHGNSGTGRDAFAKEILAIMLRRLAPFVPRMKNPFFAEEGEWRLVAIPLPARDSRGVDHRASARGILPYIRIDLADEGQPLPLDRVYVGPTQEPHRGLSVTQAYLAKQGYVPEIAVSSRIPFRGAQ